MKQVVAEFEKKHPGIHVTTRRRHQRRQDLAAIPPASRPTSPSRAPPTTSASTARPAPGSTSTRYMKRDNIPASTFPAAPRYYTQYKGKRCALPLLADAYGLYYNKTMFKKAGSRTRRRRCRELTAVREEADRAQLGRLAQGRRASTRSTASTRTRPRTGARSSARSGSTRRASRSSPRARAGRSS